MITEDYVSFETAKLLKEKGFDENTPVNYFVGDDKPRGCVVGEMIYHKRLEEDTHLIAAPTRQMAMKWLRETKDIQVVIGILNTIKKTWTFALFRDFDGLTQKFYSFKTYEEACEAAIKYCLENLI